MFDRFDLDAIHEAKQEAYGYIEQEFIVKRLDTEASEIDDLYDEVRKIVTKDTVLRGSVVRQPDDKVLTKFGLMEPVDLMISVPRKTLTDLDFMIEVTDLIEYEGDEYVIERVAKDTVLPVAEGDGTQGKDFLALLVFAKRKIRRV